MPKIVRPDPARDMANGIECWRRYAGLTQDEAGSLIGVTRKTYSQRIAQGNMTVREFWRLAAALKIPRDDAAQMLLAGLGGQSK